MNKILFLKACQFILDKFFTTTLHIEIGNNKKIHKEFSQATGDNCQNVQAEVINNNYGISSICSQENSRSTLSQENLLISAQKKKIHKCSYCGFGHTIEEKKQGLSIGMTIECTKCGNTEIITGDVFRKLNEQ